jgi:hypothetical protein
MLSASAVACGRLHPWRRYLISGRGCFPHLLLMIHEKTFLQPAGYKAWSTSTFTLGTAGLCGIVTHGLIVLLTPPERANVTTRASSVTLG